MCHVDRAVSFILYSGSNQIFQSKIEDFSCPSQSQSPILNLCPTYNPVIIITKLKCKNYAGYRYIVVFSA